MATALHPQTQLTFKFDNQILPRKYGFPMKCRIPTKLGFKNPKYITAHVRAEQRRRRLLGEPGLQLVQRAVAGLFKNLRCQFSATPGAGRRRPCQPQPGPLAIRPRISVSEASRYGNPQASSSPRRRHRPGGHGRGQEAHRLDERPRHGDVRDRGGAGRRRLLRRPQRVDHRRHHGEGARRRCRDLRRGRRAEVGQGALRRAAGGGAAAAAQGPRAFSPTSARR